MQNHLIAAESSALNVRKTANIASSWIYSSSKVSCLIQKITCDHFKNAVVAVLLLLVRAFEKEASFEIYDVIKSCFLSFETNKNFYDSCSVSCAV